MNSLDPLSKTGNMFYTHYKLIPFHIRSLFTLIPISDLKVILNSYIEDITQNVKLKVETKALLMECLSQTYFTFNNKFAAKKMSSRCVHF